MIEAYLVHRSTSRIRVRIPEKRYDEDYFQELEQHIKNFDASLDLKVNAKTGSLLIQGVREWKPVFDFVKAKGLLTKLHEPDSQKQASDSFFADVRGGGHWVLKGLLGLGLVQLFRGHPLAPTSTLFMDAYRLWQSQRPR